MKFKDVIGKWIKSEKANEFKQALVTGKLRELVALKGGTGDLRKPISQKEWSKKKKRRQLAKQSRKRNRKVS